MKKWNLRLSPLAVVAFLAALTPCGCGPSDGTRATSTGGEKAVADPWPKFVAAVRNNPDPKATRGAVGDLSAGMASLTPSEPPKAADLDALTAALNLTDAERKLLTGSEYPPLDANYLSECLYLFDAAAALGVAASDPVPERAGAAFRFVCRQVVLNPWRAGDPNDPTAPLRDLPPVPPAFVLNRLSGSGLERAVVFVALCRQLDLDAYLIGPPEATTRTWAHPAGEGQPAKGPFWAVGVRSEQGVLLYDPWRGEAVPSGKATDRPATLAELRADPSVCPWLTDKAKPWGVSADEIKASGLFLAPPLQALSPRMALMHDKLAADVGVRVAVDWAAAVRTAENASGGAPVAGWSPKGDPFSPVRALAHFMPTDQGGLASPSDRGFVFGPYLASLLPQDKVGQPPVEVINLEAQSELRKLASAMFFNALLVPPTPREQIQRGQYNEATKLLVERSDRFFELNERIKGGPGGGESLKGWFDELNTRFDAVSRARGTPAEAAQREEAGKFLKDTARQVERVIGGMVGEVAMGEVTYLLALAAHEQAEAAELTAVRTARDPAARPGAAADARGKAKSAWGAAVSGWRRFASHADAQMISFPGRKENAVALYSRAEKLAK